MEWMTQQESKQVVFQRDLGENAPDLIANLVISGTIPAIEELVANSYDADATRVDIEFNPKEDVLTIRDDGIGMAADDGLEGFYRLGDSHKLKHPISPGGRTRIGKFGVGTILIKYLCGEYELVTEKDGRRTVIKEELEDIVSSKKQIPGVESKSDQGSGTQITMRKLKFSGDEDFSLDELRNRLQWDLPILPDFSLFVNNEKVSSKTIENADTFRVSTKGEHMGEITGNIYSTKRATKMAGIHIYVNGRRVGDPRTLLKSVVRHALVDRLVGIIHADGLEEAILFDRGRFREDHPGVRELNKTVHEAIRQK